MNYKDYRIVFQNFVLQPHTGVQSFSISDDDRVLTLQEGTAYPQLQLDTPTYRPMINRGSIGKKIFEGQVAIIGPVNKDDWAAQDRLLDDLEPEMDALIKYLDYNRKLGWGTITSIGTAYPIKRWEADNLWGWGIDLTIEAKFNYCHEPDNDVEIIHFFPEFTPGDDKIRIRVNAVEYVADWEEDLPAERKRAVKSIASQVNSDTATSNIKAESFLETLILIHTLPGTSIPYEIALPGHQWTPNV